MTMQRQLWWAQPTLHDGGGGSRPLYTWIPASAEMAGQVQQDAAGVWGVPRFFFLIPHEWGIKGG